MTVKERINKIVEEKANGSMRELERLAHLSNGQLSLIKDSITLKTAKKIKDAFSEYNLAWILGESEDVYVVENFQQSKIEDKFKKLLDQISIEKKTNRELVREIKELKKTLSFTVSEIKGRIKDKEETIKAYIKTIDQQEQRIKEKDKQIEDLQILLNQANLQKTTV